MSQDLVQEARDGLMAQRPVHARLGAEALDQARAAGCDGVVLSISQARKLRIGCRARAPETWEQSATTDICVTVYRGGTKGQASARALTPASVCATVERAVAIAARTQPDAANGLPPARPLAERDLGLWHPWAEEADGLLDRAILAEAAGLDSDNRIVSCEHSEVTSTQRLETLMTSEGFQGQIAHTHHGASIALVAREAGGTQHKVSHFDETCDPAELIDPVRLGREAAARTLVRLGARSLSTRTCPVLFTPEVAAGFWRALLGALSGPALVRGRSYLAGQIDCLILPPDISLVERPLLHGALGSRWFDGEGQSKQDSAIIAEGYLRRYLLDSHAARRLGLEGTANAGGFANVVAESRAPLPVAGLWQTMGSGLVVTQVLGHGFDPASGDFSVGASGLWVENGEVLHAVEGVTIAATVPAMLSGLVGLGDDRDRRDRVQTGSMLFAEMTVAGT